MPSLHELISRIRAWRLWRALGRVPAAAPAVRPRVAVRSRLFLREVTAGGVRVYSLCGQCGAPLSASATLCDACARSRSTPNS